MNRKWLALATALMISPAYADMTLPPAQYDIGGATEADTLVNYSDLFGNDGPPLIRVPYGQAKRQCDMVNIEHFGVPYPASETADGSTLLGCFIRNLDRSNPVVVYSYDPDSPWLGNQILRHEVGHLMGWSGTHER